MGLSSDKGGALRINHFNAATTAFRRTIVLTAQVLEAGVADDRFVFAFSDANFERYGLTAQDGKPAQLFFSAVLGQAENKRKNGVHMYTFG